MNIKAKLSIAGEPLRIGEASTWDEITDKPFSEVDTENGLAIYDDTLMLDTLDTIATIDYVNGKIDEVEADIPSLDGYATEQYVDNAVADIDIPTADGTTIIDNNGVWSAVGGGTTTVDWDDVQNKPTFATVATSGDYDDLSNKPTIPSIDGLATEQYVDDAIADIQDPEWDDIQNKPTFATVATSGSYNDLSNKPTIPTVPTNVSAFTNDAHYVNNQYVNAATTAVANSIPQADGTTIIDRNGVWSARGGSSTQSDWEQNDSSASDYVKNRTHYVTRTSVDESWDNDGNPLTDGTYPEEEWDNYHKVEWKIYNDEYDPGVRPLQDVIDFIDSVPEDSDFTVTINYGYTYTWDGSDESGSDEKTFTFHKDNDGDYNFDAEEDWNFLNLNYEEWEDPQYYKIEFDLNTISEDHDGDPRLDTELTSIEFACQNTTVSYTKLDSNYINIDNNTIKVNGGGQLYADNSMNAKMGISISNKDISVKSDLNAFGPVDMGGRMNENKLNTLNTPLGTYVGGGIIKTASTDDAENIKFTTWPSLSFDSSSTRREKWRCTNFTGDRNLRRVHAITKYYKWYDNRWFGPYYISGMFIGERINDSYEIKIEGWESILDSIVHNGGGYDFTFKEDITISPTESTVPFPFIFIQGRDNIPDPQKINSYFLPLDNSTIVRDSDGNIKTAIPEPPTTDGTYTLQAVVSNGTITYSWI